jgi:hypothetical protein
VWVMDGYLSGRERTMPTVGSLLEGQPGSRARYLPLGGAPACGLAICGDLIGALTQGRAVVLVALGELLEVQQLPPGHDQVANRQPEGGPAGRPHDDLE